MSRSSISCCLVLASLLSQKNLCRFNHTRRVNESFFKIMWRRLWDTRGVNPYLHNGIHLFPFGIDGSWVWRILWYINMIGDIISITMSWEEPPPRNVVQPFKVKNMRDVRFEVPSLECLCRFVLIFYHGWEMRSRSKNCLKGSKVSACVRSRCEQKREEWIKGIYIKYKGLIPYYWMVILIALQNDLIELYVQFTKDLKPIHDIKLPHEVIATYNNTQTFKIEYQGSIASRKCFTSSANEIWNSSSICTIKFNEVSTLDVDTNTNLHLNSCKHFTGKESE